MSEYVENIARLLEPEQTNHVVKDFLDHIAAQTARNVIKVHYAPYRFEPEHLAIIVGTLKYLEQNTGELPGNLVQGLYYLLYMVPETAFKQITEQYNPENWPALAQQAAKSITLSEKIFDCQHLPGHEAKFDNCSALQQTLFAEFICAAPNWRVSFENSRAGISTIPAFFNLAFNLYASARALSVTLYKKTLLESKRHQDFATDGIRLLFHDTYFVKQSIGIDRKDTVLDDEMACSSIPTALDRDCDEAEIMHLFSKLQANKLYPEGSALGVLMSKFLGHSSRGTNPAAPFMLSDEMIIRAMLISYDPATPLHDRENLGVDWYYERNGASALRGAAHKPGSDLDKEQEEIKLRDPNGNISQENRETIDALPPGRQVGPRLMAFSQLIQQWRTTPGNDNAKARALLLDYTKEYGGSEWVGHAVRLVTCHYGRNHTALVSAFLEQKQQALTAHDITVLKGKLSEGYNINGSLAARLDFLKVMLGAEHLPGKNVLIEPDSFSDSFNYYASFFRRNQY